jgi:HEAT repeat protein
MPPVPPASQELPVETARPLPEAPKHAERSDAYGVLYALAGSSDAAERSTAIAALDTQRDAYAVYTALKALADPAAEVRDVAFEACASADTALLADQIMGLWLREEPETAAVVAVLPGLRHKLEKPFLSLIEQPTASQLHRVWAVYGLGCMGSTDGVESLLRMAWQEDPTLAWYALWALVSLPAEVSVQPLLELCRHPSEPNRAAALEAVIAVPGYRATLGLSQVLMQLSQDDLALAGRVVTGLGARKDQTAVPYLISALDRFPELLETTGEALRTLTGEPLSNAPQPWRDWYAARQGALPKGPPPSDAKLYELAGIDSELVQRIEQ